MHRSVAVRSIPIEEVKWSKYKICEEVAVNV